MGSLKNDTFKAVIGSLVIVLVLLQFLGRFRPKKEEASVVLHLESRWYPWSMGLGAGVITMLANAAGPVTTLYFLSMKLPKFDFVATSAWFFLAVNLVKVPFSTQLGLIHEDTLLFTATLAPAVAVGFFVGRHYLRQINQKLFEDCLLALTGITALHLIFS